MPIFPGVRRLRLDDHCELEGNLDYKVNSRYISKSKPNKRTGRNQSPGMDASGRG